MDASPLWRLLSSGDFLPETPTLNVALELAASLTRRRTMLTMARHDLLSVAGAQAGRLAVAGRKGQLPLAPAQLEGQVQPRRRCAKMLFVGRCHDRLLGKTM
jgi:hypothetical protein